MAIDNPEATSPEDLEQATLDYWQNQPHPLARSLRIGDFATAVKVATKIKFGGHASPAEAALFWPQFTATGMSPQDFEHAVDQIAPLSFTYHGRPPSLRELTELREKAPREVRSYFADLPDRHYPHVTAGEMVKMLFHARPHAQEHLGRSPNKYEAAYLHHSGEHPREYYARLAADRDAKDQSVEDQKRLAATQQPGQARLQPQQINGIQAPLGGHAGDRGLAPTGRSQAGQ